MQTKIDAAIRNQKLDSNLSYVREKTIDLTNGRIYFEGNQNLTIK